MCIYKYIGPKYIGNIFGPAYKNLALWKQCAPYWWCLWLWAAKAADHGAASRLAGLTGAGWPSITLDPRTRWP